MLRSISFAMNNGDINKDGNDASQQDRFLFDIISHEKKIEYLTINDPLILWNNLRDIYIRILENHNPLKGLL
jgi:hypothetical protein